MAASSVPPPAARRSPLALPLAPLGEVPTETARVAAAAFPKGTAYVRMRDALGTISADADFAALVPARGRPAETPWRLALVTVMQFAEGLADRQAAEAVRARIDWKYALGLDLTDPGFDFSVLSGFRARLVAGEAAHLLLDRLLVVCTAQGLLKARGRQRTDSTHVLGALRVLSRLERVAEAMRVALEAVAAADPAWLQAHAPADWYVRYGRRIEEYRLPRGKDERAAFVATVGADGVALLAALAAAETPAKLPDLPEVAVLWQVWDQQYAPAGDGVRFRATDELPAAADQIETPHEAEARFAIKRSTTWTGYKAHLTETCDEDTPTSSPRSRPRSPPTPTWTASIRSRTTWRARRSCRATSWSMLAMCGAAPWWPAKRAASRWSDQSKPTVAGKPRRRRGSRRRTLPSIGRPGW